MCTNQCSLGCDDGLLNGKTCPGCNGSGLQAAPEASRRDADPARPSERPIVSGSTFDYVQ
jgi:hypothetical protein